MPSSSESRRHLLPKTLLLVLLCLVVGVLSYLLAARKSPQTQSVKENPSISRDVTSTGGKSATSSQPLPKVKVVQEGDQAVPQERITTLTPAPENLSLGQIQAITNENGQVYIQLYQGQRLRVTPDMLSRLPGDVSSRINYERERP